MFPIAGIAKEIFAQPILNLATELLGQTARTPGPASAAPFQDQINFCCGSIPAQGARKTKRKRGGFLKRAFKGISKALQGATSFFKKITGGLGDLLKGGFEKLRALLPAVSQFIPGAGVLGGLLQGMNLFDKLFGNK